MQGMVSGVVGAETVRPLLTTRVTVIVPLDKLPVPVKLKVDVVVPTAVALAQNGCAVTLKATPADHRDAEAPAAEASVVPTVPATFCVTTNGLVAGLDMEVPIVTAEEGDDASVTVTVWGVPARTVPVDVAILQFTVIAVVETLIPLASAVLVEKATASRGRIALDLSILKCGTFISLSFF